MAIEEFKNEYHFLSNFHLCRIFHDGLEYRSVEHAYQASKTMDLARRQKIAAIINPGDVKRYGKTVELRSDWLDVRISVMWQLVFQKFALHLDLQEQLLKTDNQTLIETNFWHDTFWGVYEGNGHNHLGRILMEVRTHLARTKR